MSDAGWLLDVNALIALISPGHLHHEAMHDWFALHRSDGWATCPITENGAVRVLSQPVFARGGRRPEAIVKLLLKLRQESEDHRFWADDISLAESAMFHLDRIIGPKLITDVYLLGLASRHNATLVSFDRNLPWQAIRNGTARLIATPLLQ